MRNFHGQSTDGDTFGDGGAVDPSAISLDACSKARNQQGKDRGVVRLHQSIALIEVREIDTHSPEEGLPIHEDGADHLQLSCHIVGDQLELGTWRCRRLNRREGSSPSVQGILVLAGRTSAAGLVNPGTENSVDESSHGEGCYVFFMELICNKRKKLPSKICWLACAA